MSDDERDSASHSGSDGSDAGSGDEGAGGAGERRSKTDPLAVVISLNEEIEAMEEEAEAAATSDRPERAAVTLIAMKERLSEIRDILKRVHKEAERTENEKLIKATKKVARRALKLSQTVTSHASSEELAGGGAVRKMAKNAANKRSKERNTKYSRGGGGYADDD